MNKILHLKTFLAGVALLASLAPEARSAPSPAASNQPSFSCKSPTALEAAICGDPALAARDRTIAVLYAAAPGARDVALIDTFSPI
jgi:uncharacterized protein